MTLGVCAYLFDKQGTNYALTFSGADGDIRTGFLSGAAHLEQLLSEYQKALLRGEPKHSLAALLEDVSAAWVRHMVMVVITDSEGLASIDEALVQRMIYHNDVDPFLAMDAALHREEVDLRLRMDGQAERVTAPYRVFFHSLSREEEIIDALSELFRRRRGVR